MNLEIPRTYPDPIATEQMQQQQAFYVFTRRVNPNHPYAPDPLQHKHALEDWFQGQKELQEQGFCIK